MKKPYPALPRPDVASLDQDLPRIISSLRRIHKKTVIILCMIFPFILLFYTIFRRPTKLHKFVFFFSPFDPNFKFLYGFIIFGLERYGNAISRLHFLFLFWWMSYGSECQCGHSKSNLIACRQACHDQTWCSLVSSQPSPLADRAPSRAHSSTVHTMTLQPGTR